MKGDGEVIEWGPALDRNTSDLSLILGRQVTARWLLVEMPNGDLYHLFATDGGEVISALEVEDFFGKRKLVFKSPAPGSGWWPARKAR